MAYQVIKTVSGKKYVYEYTSIWDKKNKKYTKKSKYIGKLDEETGTIIKKSSKKSIDHKFEIVDYGDSYIIQKIYSQYNFVDLVKKVFSKYHNEILSLISFQIIEGSAMKNVQSWIEGNYLNKLYKNPDLSSQKISKVLGYMGSPNIKDRFLSQYSKTLISANPGVLIDTTYLNSSIDNNMNNWGYTSNGIHKCLKYLMLIDKKTKLPMYYRLIPGNIPDVSVLKTSIEDIQNLNLSIDGAIFDAGFYSNENIDYLINQSIDFTTRIPRGRRIFKDIINDCKDIEMKENAVIYGERCLFLKEKEIIISGKKVYAYVILDLKKRSLEVLRKTKVYIEEKEDNIEINYDKAGYFVLLSSTKIEKQDVLPTYYSRQEIEQAFGFSKNNNNLLPLRVHGPKQLNGYLLLSFMSLIVYILLREKVKNIMTVEESLIVMRNLKCKIYNSSKKNLFFEPNKKHKIILHALDYMGDK